MRVFISDFLTTPFLNEDLSNNLFPYFLFEEILNKSKFDENEIDLIYVFGIKKSKNLFSKNNGSFLFLGNTTSSVVSGLISAIDLLKNNKANIILMLSVNEKKEKNPFFCKRNQYLKEAKRFGINKPLLDEILIKSYFKYDQFFSSNANKEFFQPIFVKKERNEIFLKDHFFLKGIKREDLNLSKLLSENPWEIFSNCHFAESSTGGCALILINEKVLKDKNLNNLSEICFFDYIKTHKVSFPVNLIETLVFLKEFSFNAVFSSTPCIIEEALIRGFFSDCNLHKEYIGSVIDVEEINPFGSEVFWGWAKGTNFLRRIGFLKNYLKEKKGKGLIIEKILNGPDFLMELMT